jgi:hypothetical protein
MSPEEQTALIVEIPCQYDSEYWEKEDRELINKVALKMTEIGWIQDEEITDALVCPLYYAYPVLQIGSKDRIERLFNYL